MTPIQDALSAYLQGGGSETWLRSVLETSASPTKPQTVKPSEAIRALDACISAQLPAIIWGSPGVGKSDIVAQLADSRSWQLIDVRAPQFDAVDLRGLPSVLAGKTVWNTPDFWPVQGCPDTLLFFDELNRAPQMTQNALLQLILNRRLGDYRLPDNVAMAAACNRESDGGGVQKMTAAFDQ